MSKSCDINNKKVVNNSLKTEQLKQHVKETYNSTLYVETKAHSTSVQLIPLRKENSSDAFRGIKAIVKKINNLYGNIMEQPRSLNNGVAYSTIKYSDKNLHTIRTHSPEINENNKPVEDIGKIFFNINPPDVVRKESIPKLNTLLSSVMSSMGVSIEKIDTYKSKYKLKTGKDLDQLGLAVITDNILAYSEDDGVTLPEEAIHFIVEANINSNELQNILTLTDSDGVLEIAKTQVWKDNYDSYLSIYGDPELAKQEIVGKILAQYIYDKYDKTIGQVLINALKKFINFVTFGLAKLKVSKQLDRNKFNENLRIALDIVIEKIENKAYNSPFISTTIKPLATLSSTKFKSEIEDAIKELQRRISNLLDKEVGLKGDTEALQIALMSKYGYTDITNISQFENINQKIANLKNIQKTSPLNSFQQDELHELQILAAIAIDELNSSRVSRNQTLISELSNTLKTKEYQLGISNYILGSTSSYGGVQKEINDLLSYIEDVINGKTYLDIGRYNSLYISHKTHFPIINAIYNLYLNGGTLPDLTPIQNDELMREIKILYSKLQYIDQFLVSNVEQVKADFYVKYQKINPNLKNNSRLSEISLVNYMFGSLKNVKEDLGRIFYNKLLTVHNRISEKVYNKVTDLYNLISKDLKKMGREQYQKMKETDQNGNFTGYFTSPVKTWLYVENRIKFLKDLRLELAIHAKTKYGKEYLLPEDPNELDDFFSGVSLSQNNPLFYQSEVNVRDELKSLYYTKLGKWDRANTEVIPNVQYVISERKKSMNRSQFKRWYAKNITEYVDYMGLPQTYYKGELRMPKLSIYENPQYNNLTQEEKNVLESLKAAVLEQKRKLPKRVYSYEYNNLLPQVSKSLLDTITNKKDLGKGLKEKFKESFLVREDDTLRGNRFNGYLLDRPPLRYVNAIDPSLITDDLFRATALFIEMGENYREWVKELPEINGMVDIVRFSKVGDKEVNDQNETSLLQQKMQALINQAIYGEETGETKFLGKDISKLSLLMQDYIRRLNLILNYPAILLSYISGKVNTYRQLFIKNISTSSYRKATILFNLQLPNIISSYEGFSSNNKIVVLARALNIVDDNKELFSDLDKWKTTRSVNGFLNYGGFRAADIGMKYPVIIALAMDMKYVNGNWENYKTYKGSKEDWEVSKSLWDMISVSNSKIIYDPIVTKEVLDLFKNKAEYITKVVDLQSNKFDRGVVQSHSIGRFLAIHMNWFYETLGLLFKPEGFNYQTQQHDKGIYISLSTILKSILTKDINNLNKIDIDNALQIVFFMGTATLINALSYLLNALALDDDKDEIDPMLAYVTYLTTRLSMELGSYISASEAIEYVSKPIAGVEKINNIITPISLLLSIFEEEDENLVEDGIYEEYNKSTKNFIKAIPGIRGFFETFGGGYINEYLDKPNQTISVSILDKNDYLKNAILNKVSITFELGSLITKPIGYYTGRKIAEKYSDNPNSKNLYSLPTKKENK